MTNKKLAGISILIMALIFGLLVVGCDYDAPTDIPGLPGSDDLPDQVDWDIAGYVSLNLDNGNFTYSEDISSLFLKGTYTADNGELTLTTTDWSNDGTNWSSVSSYTGTDNITSIKIVYVVEGDNIQFYFASATNRFVGSWEDLFDDYNVVCTADTWTVSSVSGMTGPYTLKGYDMATFTQAGGGVFGVAGIIGLAGDYMIVYLESSDDYLLYQRQ